MKNNNSPAVKRAYELAQHRYQAAGVDTEQALKKRAKIPISLHCWQGDDVSGFEVLPRRWVVERTFAWLGRYKRLAKDYELNPVHSESMIYVAMIQLLLKRLAT